MNAQSSLDLSRDPRSDRRPWLEDLKRPCSQEGIQKFRGRCRAMAIEHLACIQQSLEFYIKLDGESVTGCEDWRDVRSTVGATL